MKADVDDGGFAPPHFTRSGKKLDADASQLTAWVFVSKGETKPDSHSSLSVLPSKMCIGTLCMMHISCRTATMRGILRRCHEELATIRTLLGAPGGMMAVGDRELKSAANVLAARQIASRYDARLAGASVKLHRACSMICRGQAALPLSPLVRVRV